MTVTPPASTAPGDKTIWLIRHGQTTMNVFMETHRMGDADFVDPLDFDTRLTALGERQASALAARCASLVPAPKALLASPLTRALSTAERAFARVPASSLPREAVAAAAERLWLSSDVGRPAATLAAEFPDWDFTRHVDPPCGWWHSPLRGAADNGNGESLNGNGESVNGQSVNGESVNGESMAPLVEPEPEPAFAARMLRCAAKDSDSSLETETETETETESETESESEWPPRLRSMLAERPESCLALVAHWGTIYALTGLDFENAEMRAVRLSEILAHERPFVTG